MLMGRTLLFTEAERAGVERVMSVLSTTVGLDFGVGLAAGPAKDLARETVVQALSAARRTGVLVRISGPSDPEQVVDLDALASVLGNVEGLVVPEVTSADEVVRLGERLETMGFGALRIVPMIETCAAVLAAADIAAAPRVGGVVLGAWTLAKELGVSPVPGEGGLDPVRVHLAVAARAAGLPAPVDGPHPTLDDVDGLRRSSGASRALGFGGRVVLRSEHLATVSQAYDSTDAELKRARDGVVAAASPE